MRVVTRIIATLALAISACGSSSPPPASTPLAGAGGVEPVGNAGRVGAAGASGDASVSCDASQATPGLTIASAALSTASPQPLATKTQLDGEGLAPTLMPQQNPTGGLRWQGDRVFLLSDMGFWDIPRDGAARWHSTAGTAILLMGVRSGDFDGDGDQDLLLLSMNIDPAAVSSGAPSPLVSSLRAWERTPEGLVERGEVIRTPGMSFPVQHAVSDVDADSDLDIVTYERGEPIAYINDGAFAFSRRSLGPVASEYKDMGVLFIDYTDRNRDGVADLLLVMGSFTSNQLGNSLIVMLGDGSGKLGAPALSGMGVAPLVPHGPDGMGIGVADVTADGIPDVLMQDPEGGEDAPNILLFASTGPTSIAPALKVSGLGFEFADVDEDGHLDIVTTRSRELQVLLSRANGMFEARDLGIAMPKGTVVDFVMDPGAGKAPPVVYALQRSGCTP